MKASGCSECIEQRVGVRQSRITIFLNVLNNFTFNNPCITEMDQCAIFVHRGIPCSIYQMKASGCSECIERRVGQQKELEIIICSMIQRNLLLFASSAQ